MLPSIRAFLCPLICVAAVVPAYARQWSDVSGKYTLEADLIGFDDERVILQRENKELGACLIEKLSQQDREYLKSRAAQEIHDENIGTTQTWTFIRGLKVTGRIVDYTRRNITVQRRRGKTYVDQTVYQNLPEVYQTMLLRVVEQLESIEVPDKRALEKWVRSLRGQPRVYSLDGVILELENGDEYEMPFFLFTEADQAVLRSGWDAWLEVQQDYEKREEQAFHLQAQAAAYQQDQQFQRQIAMMNFNMQKIQSGLSSAWEVTLYPAAGNPNPPQWVVVMGRNSEIAKQNALSQNRGYVAGPIRKVSF